MLHTRDNAIRTTVGLSKDLLEEAKKMYGAKTMAGTVILLLQRLIQPKKIERPRSLRGELDLDVDLKRLRKDRSAIH